MEGVIHNIIKLNDATVYGVEVPGKPPSFVNRLRQSFKVCSPFVVFGLFDNLEIFFRL